MMPDQHILRSWHTNAHLWTKVIREETLESRKLVTNQAILDVIFRHQPQNLLDLGCGEGWLARKTQAAGIESWGTDAVPNLIADAEAAGGASFLVADYEAIQHGAVAHLKPFDAVVANFALLGGDAVQQLLAYLPNILSSNGRVFIQTIHPAMTTGNLPYADGWRESDWTGFPEPFVDPYPWYFRTIGGWIQSLHDADLQLVALHEPLHPVSGKPASLILVAQAGRIS